MFPARFLEFLSVSSTHPEDSVFVERICNAFRLFNNECYLLSAPAKGSIKQHRMTAGTVSTETQKLGTIFQSRASPLQSEASGQYIQCYRHRLSPAKQETKKS